MFTAEVGDYDPQDHAPGYIAQFKMLPKQTQKQEEKIAELHKTLTYDTFTFIGTFYLGTFNCVLACYTNKSQLLKFLL